MDDNKDVPALDVDMLLQWFNSIPNMGWIELADMARLHQSTVGSAESVKNRIHRWILSIR